MARQASLVSAGSAAAAHVLSSDGAALVWAIDTATNKPLAGAIATLYDWGCYACSPSDIRTAATATTDGSGVAALPPPRAALRNRRALLVEAPSGETLFLPSLPSRGSAPPAAALRSVLLSDRAVYKAGDPLHLHGYVRLVERGTLASPATPPRLRISARWGDGGETLLDVDYEPSSGSFSLSTAVPAGAQYGEHRVSLLAFVRRGGPGFAPGDNRRLLDSVTLAVADPRPPTVAMDASVAAGAMRVVPPGGSVSLSLATRTLSGVPLGGARVTLRWRVDGRPTPPTCSYCLLPRDEAAEGEEGEELPSSGEEVLVTGGDGSLAAEWSPPPNASRPLKLGDSLHLSFEWVGPTREVVSRSLAVPVALSERTVRLEPPSHSELPSVPFTPRLTVRRHEALGGEPVAGATVALALFQLSRADGSATLDARPSPELDSAADLFHGVEWLVDGRPTALPPESANLLRDQPGCNGLTTSSEGRADTAQACALQLPSMGHFLLAACEEGGVCSAVVLGRSRPQWRRKPAGSDYLERALSPALDAETYARGETASIRVYNPLGSPLAVLVAWGNTLSRRHITPPPLPPGDGAVQLTLGEECVGGCRISLHLAAASNASRTALPGDVPTSLLLEPRAPMLASFDLAASVPSPANAITVSVTAARPVELPGAAGAVTVRLADASGSPVAGEVALLAVDRALLQLRPNPPVDVGGALSPDVMGGDYAATSSYEQLVSAAGLANASARLLSLLEADPFLRLSWRARASSSDDWQLSDLERDPSDVLAANVGALTQLPSGSGGMYGDDLRHGIDGGFFGDNLLGGARSGGAPEMMLKAAPMMAFAAAAPMEAMDDAMPMARSSRSSAGRPPPAAGPGVHVRSNFVTTPLFRPSLRVGPSGELTVPWTLPDNTGSFELRAYAVSDKGDGFGHGTAEQLVRKPLSLSASTPRIGRVGDAFSCGVTLTAAPDLPAGTAATVTLGLAPATSQPAPLSLLETNRTLSLAPSQTVEVAFEMRAVAIGSAVLTARVSASGAPADALELKLPILGQQPPVQLATSRALVATAAPSLWREGISLPRAVPGSGSLTATFGAGRLPAVEAIASALLRAADPSPPDAIDGASACLGLVGAHAALLPYAAGRSVPSLGAAAALAVESAAAPLEQLSNQYGLHNGPSAASYAAEHRTCNTQLTALGLFLLRKLALAGRLRALPALAALAPPGPRRSPAASRPRWRRPPRADTSGATFRASPSRASLSALSGSRTTPSPPPLSPPSASRRRWTASPPRARPHSPCPCSCPARPAPTRLASPRWTSPTLPSPCCATSPRRCACVAAPPTWPPPRARPTTRAPPPPPTRSPPSPPRAPPQRAGPPCRER